MKSLAIGIFSAVLLIKVFLAVTTGLGDDEAYYWNWAQFLDWSYFDHPGMVAWLIHLSESIFGRNEFAVRFPSILIYALSSFFIYRVADERYGKKASYLSIIFYALIPVFFIGSTMMVPDMPLLFFWSLCIYLTHLLMKTSDSKNYFWLFVALGFTLGFSFLSKYPGVLLFGSLGILYLFGHWKIRPKWYHILLTLVAFMVASSPVMIWNLLNDWPSFAFHLSDRHQGGHFSVGRWFQFLATQLIFLSPSFFVLFVVVLIKRMDLSYIWKFKTPQDKQNDLFFSSFALPSLLLFGLQPLMSDFKPHWIAPAYLALIPLASDYFLKLLSGAKKKRLWAFISWGSLGFVIFFNMFFVFATQYPVIAKLHVVFNPDQKWQARFDITNDLYGWPDLAKELNELTASEEREFVISSHRYQLAAPLSFYSGLQALSIGAHSNQYNYFQKGLEKHKGKVIYFVEDNRYKRSPQDSMQAKECSEIKKVQAHRYGVLAREFKIWRCEEFLGPK